MNKAKLNKVIGDGNIVIPLYILKFYKKLNLTMDEFIFLMYLYNKQDNLDFNPEKISLDLNLDIMEVMGYVSVLVDKGYMSLDLKKSETDVLEEVINLADFYEKISMFLINQEEEKKEDNIYSYIEENLARPLSSVEVETIKGWQDNKIDVLLNFNSPSYQLSINESKELNINWENSYGKLASGEYRLIKHIDIEKDDGTFEDFYVSAEFTIE